MALTVTHSTVVVVPDDGTSPVGSDEWNDAHTITGTLDAGDIGVTPAGGIAATDVQAAIEELDAEKQPLDADLTAIAALTTTAYGRGLLELADETALEATIDTLPNLVSVQGLTVTLADAGADAVLGWDDSASAYQNLSAADARTAISAQQSDATLTALAAYNTNGIIAQTAADTFAGRTITGTANQITVADGDGVAGNPTLSLHADVYRAGGTDVALADGGTGASLADPNIDRVMMWDDSAGTVKFGALSDFNTEASPTSGDFVLIYDAAGNLLKTDWANLPGGSAAAGGNTTEIQYNNAGTLDGDPDFTWVGGTGLTNGQHSKFGNGPSAIQAGYVFYVEEEFTGDLSGVAPIAINTFPTLSHTGAGEVFRLAAVNGEMAITSSSTGDIREAWGLLFYGINDQSTSDITLRLGALNAAFDHAGLGTVPAAFGGDFFFQSYDGGAGNPGIITDGYGVRSKIAWYNGVGAITNSYTFYASAPDGSLANTKTHGLYIEDHSGIGSSESNNITSKGASSLNIFEGTVGVGTPSPARKLHVELESAATNTVTQLQRLTSLSSGTPAANIGVGMEFEVETAAGNKEIGNTIESVAVDVTSTSEDFDLVFNGMAAGAAAAERFRIKSTNTLVAPSGQVAHFWVYWTGNTTTILAQHNVSSIDDDNPGDAGINLTTAFSSANYAAFVTTNETGTDGWDADSIQSVGINVHTAGVVDVLCGFIIDGGTAAAGPTDPDQYQACGFGVSA
jgi:hypothetical protein